jgi:hypothetical protein
VGYFELPSTEYTAPRDIDMSDKSQAIGEKGEVTTLEHIDNDLTRVETEDEEYRFTFGKFLAVLVCITDDYSTHRVPSEKQ